jgi:DNA polymerase III delta subunit
MPAMIYLLYGTDTTKSRAKLHELISTMQKKKPDASHMRVTGETFQASQVDELIGGMGLFASKSIVEVDHILTNSSGKTAVKETADLKERKEIILKRIKEISESENVFVFLEHTLDKKSLEKFEKYATKVQEFAVKEISEKKENNFFALSDALGRRDKKQLWVLFTKAKMKEVASEEIHGILFWQIKSMLLAETSGSAQEAGLNPFVYQKSIGFLRNFKEGEVKMISSELVQMYHQARRGIVDFDSALEKFILEV